MKHYFVMPLAIATIAIVSIGLVGWSIDLWQSNIGRVNAVEIIVVLFCASLHTGGWIMVWAREEGNKNNG